LVTLIPANLRDQLSRFPKHAESSGWACHLRDLIGAYASEIGQTQFLPSSYHNGVDYDGDGHVDLRHSVPHVLASTANLLKTNGWRAGAPFGEGTANFDVMSEWNRSVVYRKTMVLFAERLAEPEAQLESPIKAYACRRLSLIEGASAYALPRSWLRARQ
jgi:membrane-bound lytic murein transglycosylase B